MNVLSHYDPIRLARLIDWKSGMLLFARWTATELACGLLLSCLLLSYYKVKWLSEIYILYWDWGMKLSEVIEWLWFDLDWWTDANDTIHTDWILSFNQSPISTSNQVVEFPCWLSGVARGGKEELKTSIEIVRGASSALKPTQWLNLSNFGRTRPRVQVLVEP